MSLGSETGKFQAWGRPGGGWWLARLCASRMCFGFIFMAYAPAVPVLMSDWKMSAAEAGLIHTGWHAGYLVSLFAVGFLTDRFGAKRVFLASSWAACAAALAFAFFANGFRSGLLLYALAGLCSGGSYTPGLALIAQRFQPRRRGAAMGWYLAASSLGYAIALFAGGALLATQGWRAAFIATALGPVIGTLLAFQALRETRNIVAHRHAGAGVLLSLAEVIRNRPAMLAIWSYAFHSWELLGLWAWLPAYLAASAAARHHGVDAAASIGAAIAGLSFVTNAFGSVLGGRLSDRLGRAAVMFGMTAASLACSLSFGWLYGLPLWFLAGIAIVYNLTALGDSSVYSTALTELVSPRYLGAAYSLRAVLGFGLGAISPAVFGLVLDAASRGGERGTLAWGLAWFVLGLGAVPGLYAISRLRRIAAASGPPTATLAQRPGR